MKPRHTAVQTHEPPAVRTMPETEAFDVRIRLDTGTHTAAVVQMARNKTGNVLVSAGDCSLRVWDLASRKVARTLLGEIGPGPDGASLNGQVRRFVLTPDGKWAVVLKAWAVEQRTLGDRGRFTDVQVFDLTTGNLQAAYRHPGLWWDLDISPDGKWLALVGNHVQGRTRKVQLALVMARDVIQGGFGRPPQRSVVTEFGKSARHEDLRAAVRFVPQRRGACMLVVAAQALPADAGGPVPATAPAGLLAWYRFAPSHSLKAVASQTTERAIEPCTLAVSPDYVVVGAADGGDKLPRFGRLFCFEHGGQSVTTKFTESGPASAVFSPSGTRLVVGLTTSRRLGTDAQPAEPSSPGNSYGQVTALQPGSDERPQDDDISPPPPEGDGQSNPVTFADEPVPETRTMPPADGDQTVQVNVYATSAGQFDLLSSYYGHDASVRALAVLDDGTVLSAGGDNQAIHLWSPAHRVGEPLGALRGVGRTYLAPGITADEKLLFGTLPLRLLPPQHAERQQSFDLRTRMLNTTCPSDGSAFDVETQKWLLLPQEPVLVMPLFNPQTNDLEAELTLFVGADDEWVLWTRSGYFDHSAKGGQRVGFHISRGPHREALFLPSDRFKDYYSPRIVQAVVEHGSEDQARAAGVDIPLLDVWDKLPPVVELRPRGVGVAAERDTVTFTFTVQAHHLGGLTRSVWILRNDRLMWSDDAPRRRLRNTYTVTLPLRPGRNVFQIKAENQHALSLPVVHELMGPPPLARVEGQAAASGNLYLLSVGVSDFQVAGTPEAGDFKALQFAHRDAMAVYNAFAKSRPTWKVPKSAPLHNAAFDDVHATLLLNEEAKKKDILDSLKSLCDQIKLRHKTEGDERDVLFVYLSGHGVRLQDQSDLFFWNFDLQPRELDLTGLSMLELGEIITSVPAEVVLAIDTCHAGLAGGNVVSGLDPEELARRIHAVSERGLYVLSASRGQELAREGVALGQGVFTSALLAALKSDRFFVREEQAGTGQGGGKGRRGGKGAGKDTSAGTGKAAGKGKRASALSMLGLIAAMQDLVPVFTAKAKVKAQTPVCRMYGDLLPLTIFKR
jgi:WD40 repeat protein